MIFTLFESQYATYY